MGNCLQAASRRSGSKHSSGSSKSSNATSKCAGGISSRSSSAAQPVTARATATATTDVHEVLSVIDHRRTKPPLNVFDYYQKLAIIGEGATCTIHSVKRIRGPADVGRIYALKTISKHREVGEDDDKYLKIRLHEVQLLRRLDHPNIVRIYEIFEDEDAVYVIMEHCSGGTLASRAPYTEKEAAKIMTKLLSAVAYCHRHGILHRDIKMDNAMFECDSKDSDVKLIDFGLGVSSRERGPPPYHEVVGTVHTMSPQIIHERGYGKGVDDWACGVVAFQLLVDKAPFDGPTRRAIAEKIIRNDWDDQFEGEEWNKRKISTSARRFVSALLTYDEEKRRSASDALRSKWLRNMDPPEERRPPEHMMRRVMTALEDHGHRAPILKKLALYFIAYHTPGEEVMELERAFDQFCGGYNIGTINAWEFRREAARHLGDNGDDEDKREMITKLFHSLATRGKIDFTTFIAATLESQGPIREDRIRAAFQLFANETGDASGTYIDRNSLTSALGVRCRYRHRSFYLDCDEVIQEAIEAVCRGGGGTSIHDSGAVVAECNGGQSSSSSSSSSRRRNGKSSTTTMSLGQFMELFVQTSTNSS